MKQRETKSMLLLPCAVIAAVIGIMVYFACSDDDEWEGSPEYLMTHAPMQTRAGVDVEGLNNFASCGIWCVAYLRDNSDINSSYDYVSYKATQLNIPTDTYLQTSQVLTLAQACSLNFNTWITNSGTNVPADTVKNKLMELSDANGNLPYCNILGYDDHYVIGKKIVFNNNGDTIVKYIDHNHATQQSKAIGEFGALIY